MNGDEGKGEDRRQSVFLLQSLPTRTHAYLGVGGAAMVERPMMLMRMLMGGGSEEDVRLRVAIAGVSNRPAGGVYIRGW